MASRGDTIDKAIALRDDASVVARLRERMPDALEQLEQMACGNVPRNAQVQLKAIETMLRFSQPLPKQVVEHQGGVSIVVDDPYAEPGDGDDGALSSATSILPAAQAVIPIQAVAPIRRRKALAPAPADGPVE